MEDADRHDQIESLTTLKWLLDDGKADENEIRDAAIRVVNRFDTSIDAHGNWKPYSRRGSINPDIRTATDQLGKRGVERHPECRGRLRRRIDDAIVEIRITETTSGRKIEARHDGPWHEVGTTTKPLADAEMMAAQHLEL